MVELEGRREGSEVAAEVTMADPGTYVAYAQWPDRSRMGAPRPWAPACMLHAAGGRKESMVARNVRQTRRNCLSIC
jgi:hypothetical protein